MPPKFAKWKPHHDRSHESVATDPLVDATGSEPNGGSRFSGGDELAAPESQKIAKSKASEPDDKSCAEPQPQCRPRKRAHKPQTTQNEAGGDSGSTETFPGKHYRRPSQPADPSVAHCADDDTDLWKEMPPCGGTVVRRTTGLSRSATGVKNDASDPPATSSEQPADASDRQASEWPATVSTETIATEVSFRNISRGFFDVLLELVGAFSNFETFSCGGVNWVDSVAAISLANKFEITRGDDKMKALIEDARKRLEKNKNYKHLNPTLALLPLKLAGPEAEIGKMLAPFFHACRIPSLLELMKKCSLQHSEVDAFDECQTELLLDEVKHKILAQNSTNDGGLKPEMFGDLLRTLDTSKITASMEAIKVVVDRIADLGIKFDPRFEDERFERFFRLALGRRQQEIPQQRENRPSDTERLLTLVQTASVPDKFRAWLDHWHLRFAVSEIPEYTANDRDAAVAFFMRIEGYGKFVKHGDRTYWWGALSNMPSPVILIDGQTRCQEALGVMRTYIALSLTDFFKTSTAVLRDKLGVAMLQRKQDAAPSEAEKAMQRILDTYGKLCTELRVTQFLESVCAQCVMKAILAPQEFIDLIPRRRFPLIAEQIEQALLNVCESFDLRHTELASFVFRAYSMACGNTGLKFTVCNTFCKELYKQSDAFRSLKYNNRLYVAGLRLKMAVRKSLIKRDTPSENKVLS